MRGGRSRADYNEWGEITYREALTTTSSYRRIYPQSNYTGHDWDDVLGMYYAKARFYSAEDKRFVSMDPVKGQIIEPLSLVPYVYCVDNPLRWVDPLGLVMGRPGNTNLELTDTGNWSAAAHTDNQVIVPGQSVLTSNPNWDGHIGRQLGNMVNQIASAIGDVTKHITDGDRQNDLVRGMITSVILAYGENGAIVLQGIINAEQKLSPWLPDLDYYKEHLAAADAFEAYTLSISMYADSYYAGKMIGDLVAAGLGLGATVDGITKAVGGILGTGGGLALSGTGVAALLGAGISAAGVATTAVGIAEGTAGSAVATAAINNFGSDKEKLEYYNKIWCEGKRLLEGFDLDNAYVKTKHLSDAHKANRRFNVATKTEAEAILRDAMQNGNVLNIILEDGLSAQGNLKYDYFIDAGKVIGTRGEHVIKVVLSVDGAMLSAYPVPWP